MIEDSNSLRFSLDSNECDFYYYMPDSEVIKNKFGFFVKNKVIDTYSYVTPKPFGEENFQGFLDYSFSYFSDGQEYFVVKLVNNDTYRRNSKILRDKHFIPYFKDVLVLSWENNVKDKLQTNENLDLLLLDEKNLSRWIEVFFDAFSYPKKLRKYITKMVKLQYKSNIEFYVGSVSNKDVSCLCSFNSHGFYGIYGVGTKKKYQRKGHALGTMSNFMMKKLENEKESKFTLQVQKRSGAELLYTKLGFKTEFTQKRFDWSPATLDSTFRF